MSTQHIYETEAADPRLTIPHRAAISHRVRDALERTETDAGDVVTIAGRVRGRRDHGRVVFFEIEDATASMQVMAESGSTAALDAFSSLALGDWVSVTGSAGVTRRGEPTVFVTEWRLLASCVMPFPDRSAEMVDADRRWRQRYLDFWVTPGARETIETRSLVISQMRRFLEAGGFVEVETPVLQSIHGGANARPFMTHHEALGVEMALRIAPELHLKRMVAGGFENVFEIGRVFRNEGISTRHNPEFTMVEIYQAYADYTDMMDLTERLVSHLAVAATGSATVTWQGIELRLGEPWRRASMRELVADAQGVDIGPHLSEPELDDRAAALGLERSRDWGWGRLLAEAFDRHVESTLVQPTFVLEHPIEISPLARPHRDVLGVAERFEVIVAGRELANVFSELNDPVIQYQRFLEQAAERDGGDEEAMPIDLDYVRALCLGLPPTGGLGIGVDRLVMLLTDTANIREVVAFPTVRPAARGVDDDVLAMVGASTGHNVPVRDMC